MSSAETLVKCSCAVALLALLAGTVVGEAQPARKVHRIGFLEASSRAASSARIEAFRKGLLELGHVEGQDVRIDSRFAEGELGELSNLAAELVGLKPDVVVSSAVMGARALRNATPEIPIVIAGADPDTLLIAPQNLARPSGNITGVISAERQLEGKRMELLRETVPTVSRVAIFRDLAIFPYRAGETTMSRPERWEFTFIPIAVRGPDDLESAFATAVRERAGALSLLNTAMLYTHRRRLADLAVRNRLAWIAADREYAEAGCLMSYGADQNDLVRRAATYVDKILKGARPAELPIEQPTTFELVVNLKTARALGLTIPQSVLLRADKVIE